jgi:hypothetical protein
MAALHETTEPVAAKGMHHVVALDSVIASTRAADAKEGEDLHTHASSASILKRLVVQAEGEGVGDKIEPRAPRPGDDAME